MPNSSSKNGVTIEDVARAVGALRASGELSAAVADVTHDSRQIVGGALFVAIRGAQHDAHEFIPQALERGAAGVISERERPKDFACAWLQVANARTALAVAADVVQGSPSRELKLVGVTGTNGKTTCAYLIAAIAESAGLKAALAGTIETRIGEERVAAERTTTEASDTQRFLRRAVEAGCAVAVMECSSQALDLHRCDALCFEVAAFTNLTRDHLDYHLTMENYFLAKRKLFDGSIGEPPRFAVTNLDDEYGARLARELKVRGTETITYALDAEADVTARDLQPSLDGTTFILRTPHEERKLKSPLIGRPHIYNVLTATACGLALGFDFEAIARAAETCAGAPGRFERVTIEAAPQDFAVVVDYAHTDDALVNVLRTARAVVPKDARIITVFGCGGDRDRTKRAPMGEAALSLSDAAILTSDNPRTEDPRQIFSDAEVGLKRIKDETNKSYRIIEDRRAAIHEAIMDARAGDLVLIAGKGHEDYQIIGDERIHFDDREVAREALSVKFKASSAKHEG